jgi:hypothetical protein
MFAYTCTQNIRPDMLPWISEKLYLIGIYKLMLLLYHKHYKWQSLLFIYEQTLYIVLILIFNIQSLKIHPTYKFRYVFHAEFIQLPKIFCFIVEACFTG